MPAIITLQELKQLKHTNYHLIDIRPQCEYLTGHLKNAVNIPYELLMTYPDSYLKKDVTYYLICAHGSLSHRACAILRAYGYNVSNVENGYDMRCCYY